MKALWYFLTVIFGFYGILAVLHTIELLVTGAGLFPAQLITAIVALLLASVFLKKARSKTPSHE
jgi:hypothetical protein